MVETLTGHNRSNGISYVELLEGDKVAPPAVYLEEAPMEPGVTTVEVSRYWTKEEHDREVERLWKRVWQIWKRILRHQFPGKKPKRGSSHAIVNESTASHPSGCPRRH